MGSASFRKISEIQSLVRCEHIGGKDEFVVTIDGDALQFNFSENDEETGRFVLYRLEAKGLADWLLDKGFL